MTFSANFQGFLTAFIASLIFVRLFDILFTNFYRFNFPLGKYKRWKKKNPNFGILSFFIPAFIFLYKSCWLGLPWTGAACFILLFSISKLVTARNECACYH